ncbi:hypothetical protein I7I48_06593 [Histoplasma ohiense]|nr:hypothetical protein I7I48_06593 [Histoplasma ohiense (nom. inval.)]
MHVHLLSSALQRLRRVWRFYHKDGACPSSVDASTFRVEVTAPLLPDKDKEGTTTFVVDDIAGHSLWKTLILNLVGNATTWVQSTEYFIPSNTFIGRARTVDDKVHMMESIAQSVTYSILEPSNQTMTGLVGLSEQFMYVRWGWIALPTFVVLATILCLCLVMMCTKRYNVEMWKSSSLALFVPWI